MMAVAAGATVVVDDNRRGVQIDGAMTSRGAGCCVAMVTANGPGRPLRRVYMLPTVRESDQRA